MVLLVASGHTNDEIARSLDLSRDTVADHLESAGRNAGTDGWFLPD